MKLSTFMTFNAIVFIALGIAFALYGPLMIAMFGISTLQAGDAVLYWYVASFARMFGAALFGLGFLIWAIRNSWSSQTQVFSAEARRSILYALLLAYVVTLFVAAIQQYNIWQSLSGWITIGLLLLFITGYGYFLVHSAS